MIKYKIVLLFLTLDLFSILLFVTNHHVTDNKIKLEQKYSNFNTSNLNDRIKKKIILERSSKWSLPIYYDLIEPVDYILISFALSEISKETCINFERSSNPPNNSPGIIYRWYGGCRSFVGKQVTSEWQVIELGKDCYNTGGIIHETLHALGLFHEHCRYDSGKYVKFNKHNMVEGSDKDFDSVCFLDSYDYFLSYDYGSIMHYGSKFASKSCSKTIVPIDLNYVKTIGHLERLSFIDIKTLNLHYCSHVCPHKIKCANHGYQDPKDCNVCRCVEGFNGKFCQNYAMPRGGCGNALFIVDGKLKNLSFKGKKYCVYHIKTYPNKRILLTIVGLNIYPTNKCTCSYKNTVEINYQIDKSVTGARFCSSEYNKLITSNNNYIIIYYRSSSLKNYAYLEFKAVDYRRNSFRGQRRRLKSI